MKKLTLKSLCTDLNYKDLTIRLAKSLLDKELIQDEYNATEYANVKTTLIQAYKAWKLGKKESKKLNKTYLYLYLGGTKENNSKLKVGVEDHLISTSRSPAGCTKYCTENQIGRPTNWVRLNPIMLPDGSYFDLVKKSLAQHPGLLLETSNVYQVVTKTDVKAFVLSLRQELFSLIESAYFERGFRQ